MLLQVVHQLFGLPGGEFQLVHAHELGPAKTISAIGVAGLTLAGEEEDGFPILVLHSLKRFLTQARDVELHLSGGMGVESALDLAGCGRDLLGRRISPDQSHHSGEILAIQHATLRECQLVDGVFGNVLPADELFDHIAVDAERQHRRHGLDGKHLMGRQSLQFRNPVKIFSRVGLVLTACYCRLSGHMFSWGLTRSGQYPFSSCSHRNSIPLPGQRRASSVLSFERGQSIPSQTNSSSVCPTRSPCRRGQTAEPCRPRTLKLRTHAGHLIGRSGSLRRSGFFCPESAGIHCRL